MGHDNHQGYFPSWNIARGHVHYVMLNLAVQRRDESAQVRAGFVAVGFAIRA